MAAPSSGPGFFDRALTHRRGRRAAGGFAGRRRFHGGVPIRLRQARRVAPSQTRLGDALVWRLLVGAGAGLGPVLVLTALDPSLPVTAPGVALILAIALATDFADRAGGLAALLAAAVILDLRFVGDRSSFGPPRDAAEAAGFLITVAAGGAMIWLIGRIKRQGAEDRIAAVAARAATNALTTLERTAAGPVAGTPSNLGRVLGDLLIAIVRVNRAHAGAFFLASADETELERAAVYGLGGAEEGLPASIPVGQGFSGQVALERRPIAIADIRTDPRFDESHLHLAGVRAMLGVPLVTAEDHLLGVVHVDLLVPHTFSATEIARLEALANRAAALIEAVRSADQREWLLEQARESRRRLELVMQAMPEAVVLVGPPDGRIVAYNDAAEALLGSLGDDETARRAIACLRRPDGEPLPLDDLPLIRAFSTGEVETGVELTVHRPESGDVPVLVSAAPLREPDGSIGAVVGVFRDIGPLQAANRLKDEFVSAVSHDLRSPLTPIRGFVQLVARDLEREGGHAAHVGWLRSIEGYVDRMTRLVDDLLDVSRLRVGRLTIRKSPVDLVALCRQVVHASQPLAHHHELTVQTLETSLTGEWDGDRLHQVVDNLVSNAIKYSPAGGRVTVSVRQDSAHGAAVVQVEDQGPGIREEDRERIFSAFHRTADATASRVPGLGLGLFICRELVAAHGGTIAVDEAWGGGTVFTIRLPLTAAPTLVPAGTRPAAAA